MKKLLSALMVLALLVSFAACAEEEKTDAERFVEDNTILNGQETFDGEHTYRVIEIPADNNVQYVDLQQAIEILSTGTGVMYFGFPECPWCRTLLPVFFEAIAVAGYDGPVYYSNSIGDRDTKSLAEDGTIVTESEGSEYYPALLEFMGDWFWEYQGLNDPTIRRLYFPTLVFFKDGEIIDVHIDTIEGQADGYDDLTQEQHDKLLDLIVTNLNKVMGK